MDNEEKKLIFFHFVVPLIQSRQKRSEKSTMRQNDFELSAEKCWCYKNKFSSNSLVILVHSARQNQDKRKLIRETWGSVSNYKDWKIYPPVFLMGEGSLDESVEVEKNIQDEYMKYRDIAKKQSFIDSYQNLTYKHTMAYEWTTTYCQNVKFVLKSDDDIIIDIFKVIDWLSQNQKKILQNNNNAFYCRVYASHRPIRNVTSKWYMSLQDYPKERFPSFCSGGAYITTIKVIQLIYPILSKLPRLRLDDVFVTGLGAERINERGSNGSKNKQKQLIIKHEDRSEEYVYHHWQLEDGMNLIREWCESTTIHTSPWSFLLIEHGPQYTADFLNVWKKICKVHNYDYLIK